jgi:SH3-like domain-containing protein
MRVKHGMLAAGAAAMVAVPAWAALVDRKPPYFGSIVAGKARMRSGPGRTYPATWLYQRADLPVRVLASFEKGQWVKVEDPGGTQGWMLGSLVSERRTAIVKPGEPLEMRESPGPGARLNWRAQAGVVGRLSKCAGGWCWFDVKGRGGFVDATRLWGVEATEEFS